MITQQKRRAVKGRQSSIRTRKAQMTGRTKAMHPPRLMTTRRQISLMRTRVMTLMIVLIATMRMVTQILVGKEAVSVGRGH